MVYQLLNKSGLCEYYELNEKPGITQQIPVRSDKFAFLEDPRIRQQLISFEDGQQTHCIFYLPQIHCSSCLYLLEHLHQLQEGVISSQVNFTRKELSLVIDERRITLRQAAELLAGIGYEPYISLNDLTHHKPALNRNRIFQLGVAGFCFSNIMLMSFPEYLGLEDAEKNLQLVFRYMNLLLSLPVFFYSAMPFYTSGWHGLRHKFLNIDAPIALAIIVTFTRSVYEVVSGTGSGYFDSMTGIVFFMLVGRILQDKTYQQLSFERDYTSYFPIAVTVLREGREVPTPLPEVHPGDTILIRNQELVPADGILTRGKAFMDYSFVTGESIPVPKEMGEIIYAGGKQTGNAIELLVIKEVTQSYLTKLWSGDQFKKPAGGNTHSFVHLLSRYFTVILLGIAALAAAYWFVTDRSQIWNVITAVLIVACPCALLLSNTFTNGNIISILGRNHFYLRNAQVIEEIAKVDHIVFDKTGTLTSTEEQEVIYEGKYLEPPLLEAVMRLARESSHPLSRSLVKSYESGVLSNDPIPEFQEYPGKGLEGVVNGIPVALGSRTFIQGAPDTAATGTQVWVAVSAQPMGFFTIRNPYRKLVPELIRELATRYPISVISGDNDREKQKLRQLTGAASVLLFNQHPGDKLEFIRSLQQQGKTVMMIGDGLNDAGALRQSNVGIALTEHTNNFTPASDAILEASRMNSLLRFIRLCKINRQIVIAAFLLSIVYNVVGLTFAVQNLLSPMVAAILMPVSSISILLVTFGSSNLWAKYLKL